MDNKKIELTKEILEATNYFKLKNVLDENGIGDAFKGGKKKSDIIKSAMKMYADLRTAVAGKKEVVESTSYTTDEKGNLTVIGEITKELGIKDKENKTCDGVCKPLCETCNVIDEGCTDSCDENCEDCNPVSEKKAGRSIESIEEHLAEVMSSYKFSIPGHKGHWGAKITELEAELEEAKA